MLNKKLPGISAESQSPDLLLKFMKGGCMEEEIPSESMVKVQRAKPFQVYLEEKNIPGNLMKKTDIYVGS